MAPSADFYDKLSPTENVIIILNEEAGKNMTEDRI